MITVIIDRRTGKVKSTIAKDSADDVPITAATRMIAEFGIEILRNESEKATASWRFCK